MGKKIAIDTVVNSERTVGRRMIMTRTEKIQL
jgi:hypothetical protein